MKPHSSLQLAVIGAGMAGLSCATHLQQQGIKVTVFEKSRGAAGRMSTRRVDDWQCDHGAQYFTASDPTFRAALAQWQQAGVVQRWTPRLQVLGDRANTPARTHANKLDPGIERFVGVPRMTAPARLMAESLKLETQYTVCALRQHGSGWQLQSDEHGWTSQHFDAVLLALPAPQVVPLVKPHAPELAALADSASMHACWALMLQYAAPLDLPFDAAFVNQGPLRWIARDNSKPGRGPQETWLLHASAEWSEANLERDAASVANDLLAAFAELGAPAPQNWLAHRWRYALAAPAMQQACAWSIEHALGLCGDWLHSGKVEGAWLSGRQLADKFMQTYSQID